MPQLTVHHLHVSQSERLPWLLEELKIPYNLKLYTRSPLLAPPEYKSLHPQGTAPILTDDGSNVVLAESGACIEYICHKYASGKLFLKPGYTNYPDFLYWWHWANASFMPAVARVFWRSSSLAGSEFTVADVMVVFPLTTFRYFYPGLRVGEYGNVLRYLGRVGEREGYRRAMGRCEDGMEVLLGREGPRRGFMESLPN
ncbi:glutathione S-transferase [Apiosordaria backusii]|uniref:Glutathione S-transferase n=1 Tax=Apiosordaria backusii TaxID=314023 RepID=A0AA40K3Q0_9PEZI|nr:glutathione S-transferase [Apiosordaria backusii]